MVILTWLTPRMNFCLCVLSRMLIEAQTVYRIYNRYFKDFS